MKTGKLTLLSTPARLALLLGLLAVALGAQPAPIAQAGTLTVCASGCDHTTLQAAINAAANDDTISVLDAVHTEASITVRKSVTIQGQGIGSTIVQAQTLPNTANSRVFAIHSGVSVIIRDMTIRYGNVIASPAQGGGIYNNGGLTLQRVMVTANRAKGNDNGDGEHAYGGGIYNNGTLAVLDSTISDNLAQGGTSGADYGNAGNAYGGGSYNSGTLTQQRTDISNNTTQGGDASGSYGVGGDAYGGGIFNDGLLTVQDNTIAGNSVQGGGAAGGNGSAGDAYGGGVAQWWSGSGDVAFRSSTISDNSARGGTGEGGSSSAGSAYGGGVSQAWFGTGTLTFTNSTISGNLAQGGAGPAGQQAGTAEGGGLRSSSGVMLSYCTVAYNQALGDGRSGGGVHSFAGQGSGPQIQSSVVAANSGPSAADGPDLYGNLQSMDYNLIEDPNGYILSGTTGNNIESSDPLLGPLQDNGGPTQTHALPVGSPTVNQVPNGSNGCGTTVDEDQRGVPRPQEATCDMGAFELEKSGQLEVLKMLVPPADPGTFDLQIDGVTERSDASHGDSTGKRTVYAGSHTVAETADVFTDLADYNSSIECRDNGGQGNVVASGNDAGPLAVTVNEHDDIVCTITNAHKTGQLEVVKDLVPDAAPGKFDLQIDGVVVKSDASDSDSTGKKTVNTGTQTVAETAGTATELADYHSSIECRDNGGQGDVVASSNDTGPLAVDVGENEDVVCTITNMRKTGQLEVVKELLPSTVSGRFDLQIDGVTWKADASDGDSTGKQAVYTGDRTVGEVAGSLTDLDNYNSSIECRDSGGQGDVVASGGDAGPLTVTVDEDDDVVCTITNLRKTGQLEVVKNLFPDADPGRFHLRIDGVIEKANATNGDSTGEKTVYTGESTVSEVAADDTDLDDYNSSIECRADGGQGHVVASSRDAGPLAVGVGDSQEVLCTITNERKTGFLEVAKDLTPDSDPGRFDLQIDGLTVKTDAGDRDSTGRQMIPIGEHMVGEVAVTDTNLADYESSIMCLDNGGGGVLVASSDDAGPLALTINEGDNVVCTIHNARRGTITIEKQTEPAGGAGFGFGDDIALPHSFSLDDRQSTTFTQIAPGGYAVTEMVPTDWYLTGIVCVDPDGGTTVDLDTATASIDLDPAEEVLCTFENTQLPDLSISKSVVPALVLPGQSITYTLVFSNAGRQPAPDLFITDVVPSPLSDVHFQSDRVIASTGDISYTWQVGGLAVGDGGVITLTGVVDADLIFGLTFTNTAFVTTTAPEWDARNNSDTAPVTVVRLAPLAVDDQYYTKLDTPFSSAPQSVLDNDVDHQGDPLTAILDGGPENGTLALDMDGTFLYTPALDFAGLDTFTYHANDGLFDSNVATVTLGVGVSAHSVYLPLVLRQSP